MPSEYQNEGYTFDMATDACGKVLLLAAKELDFMRRLLLNPGASLAEEGFVLNDAEMGRMRSIVGEVQGLPERTARERIRSLAHGYRKVEE